MICLGAKVAANKVSSSVANITIIVVLALEQIQTCKNVILRLDLLLWFRKRNVGRLAVATFPTPPRNGLEGRRVAAKVKGHVASTAPNHILSSLSGLRTFQTFGLRSDERNLYCLAADGIGTGTTLFSTVLATFLRNDRQ